MSQREWEQRIETLRERVHVKVVKPAPPAPVGKPKKTVETKAAEGA